MGGHTLGEDEVVVLDEGREGVLVQIGDILFISSASCTVMHCRRSCRTDAAARAARPMRPSE